MFRSDAIALLVEHDLLLLSAEERTSLVQDSWGISDDDPGWSALPTDLRDEILRSDGDAPEDGAPSRYDPLLRDGLRSEYVGVLNAYLARRLAAIGTVATVEGELEYLAPCPCCGYRTLAEPVEWAVCCVCFWENDGSTEPDDYSSPNYRTLGEARASFARIGACDPHSLDHVLADGPERYPRVD